MLAEVTVQSFEAGNHKGRGPSAEGGAASNSHPVGLRRPSFDALLEALATRPHSHARRPIGVTIQRPSPRQRAAAAGRLELLGPYEFLGKPARAIRLVDKFNRTGSRTAAIRHLVGSTLRAPSRPIFVSDSRPKLDFARTLHTAALLV